MYRLSFQIIIFLLSINVFAQSPHGDDFDVDCSNCHVSDNWKVNLSKVTFDHSKTKFSLVGQHQNVDCKSCHTSLVFSSAPTDCFSCHKDIHQGTVGFDCASCHTPTSWVVKDIIGLHQKGRFPLLGAHKLADCAQCHSNYTELKFDVLNADCFACHSQDYNSAQFPNHVAAKFSTDCQECHNVRALTWNTTNVNHSFFPLTGGHALPSCFSCHQQNTFSGLSQDCYSCHQQTYNNTTNPNHISAGFPTTCEVCHSINGWKPASFDHNITQFPLTGKHIPVDCADCHTSGYTGTPTNCYACHQQDYQNVSDPNHITSQFPTDCNLCHTTAGWDNGTIDHNITQFPLTGSHVQVACATCHTSGYTGTPTDCYSCHQQNFNNTTDPNHVAQNYPHDCTLCHNTSNWNDANFDHNITQFPLTGSHVQVACATCHTSGYTGTPTDCYSCHQQNFNNTTDPNHVAQNYPHDCTLCHNTTNWSDANFDHNITQFPLTGSHVQVACATCHTSGYTGTPTDCYSCHQQNFNNTTDPNHVAQNYPHDCTLCHNTTNWSDANFDHNITQFPLTGSHVQVACATCHTSGYTGTPTDCYSCHQQNFNNTTDPNHVAQNYPHDCTLCHNTTNWSDANFDHNITQFPLTGSHVQVACATCHTSGYTGTPTDCYSCHQQNFNNTTDPNHVAQNYPHDCTLCHNTTNWSDANFDHNLTQFPLTGSHVQVACATCHTSGYTGTPTDCYSCHQQNFNNTTDPNHVAQNYPHDCTLCHNTTNWSDANFDHNLTQFPLTGSHIQVACATCHTSGYTGTPTDCFACHANAFNSAVNPNHTAAGIPTSCQDCHTSAAWIPSNFNHTTTGFELLGSHQPLQCSSCHAGTLTGLSNLCISCHQAQYNSAPNHVSQSYPTTCELCHNSVAWDQTNFDHNITQFPLTGAHIQVSCENCHTSGYVGTPTDCFSCHQQNFNNTSDPNHVAQNYPHDCTLCHNTTNWNDANFDHNTTQFPLTGSHVQVACASCHTSGYTGTPTDCYSCHQSNYTNTTDPPHVLLNFSNTCQTCHTTNRWTPATFDHNFYRLRNQHATMDCIECHSETNYQPQCLSCHMDDFLNGHNAGHRTDCWNCHGTNNFGQGIILPHLQEQKVD